MAKGSEHEVRYGIDISTYVGMSIGAEHWYAHAWRYDDGSEDPDAQYMQWKAERVLTERDAWALNRKEADWKYHRAGMKSGRFDSEDDARNAAVALLREKFGPDIRIELGRVAYCDNPTVEPSIGEPTSEAA